MASHGFRRAVTLPEVLVLLALFQGAIAGVVYGWWHYGILGAVIGFPVGAAAAWVLLAAFFLLVFAVSWIVATGNALFTQGPREAWRFFRHGPKTAGPKEPPPPTQSETTA